MCASFNQKNIIELATQLFDLSNKVSDIFGLDDQVFPYRNALVITKDKTIKMSKFRYSLTPSWSKVEKVKWATYNARLNRTNSKTNKFEKIYEVPTWKSVFGIKNCVVPMLSFRESCVDGIESGKIVDFKSAKETMLLAAGIYDEWLNIQTGEIINSFAIITTEPTDYIKSIGHDRSPVLLSKEKCIEWINGVGSKEESYLYLLNTNLDYLLTYDVIRSTKSK